MTMLDREELKRILKFGLTGVANTLVDVGVCWILNQLLGMNIYLANVIGYGAGMLNSYLINRSWTFASRDRLFSMQLVRFLLVNLSALALSTLLIRLLTGFGLGDMWAKLGATGITLVVNFLASRFWVFRS